MRGSIGQPQVAVLLGCPQTCEGQQRAWVCPSAPARTGATPHTQHPLLLFIGLEGGQEGTEARPRLLSSPQSPEPSHPVSRGLLRAGAQGD